MSNLNNACTHCGQVPLDGEECNCPPTCRDRERKAQTEKAAERIDELFVNCEKLNLKPIQNIEAVQHMNDAVQLIVDGKMLSVAFQLSGICKAQISLTSKGKIKVARTETKKYQLEE
jgi:hypothetical protein